MGKKYIENLQNLYNELPVNEAFLPAKKQEMWIEMSDGICLKTDVFFPENKSNISVVLTRTCYPHQEQELSIHAAEYTRRGFGFVVQWCRGINGSQGEWKPNVYERQDGLDTVKWLSDLPFVKNIGYWGNSYLASTGWCMADAAGEKMKSMYLGVYGTDRYTSMYKDGLFRQDIFTAWAMNNAGTKIDASYLESCRYTPQIRVDEDKWNTKLEWYRDWIENTDRESLYWTKSGLWKMMMEVPQKVQIPVFIREGWYDHHLGSAIETYKRLHEKSKACSTLFIGPWRHNYDYVLEGHEVKNLKDDSVSSPYEWFFNTLIKEEKPPKTCKVYMVGADRWINYNPESDYTENNWQEWFLSTNKTDPHNVGKLCKWPEANAKKEYVYDPENPVSSLGTESCFESQQLIGSLFQPDLGYRDDVLSFVTDTFEEELGIVGEIDVSLYVSSDAYDTAFTAKLMEVFENGKTVNIRGSITTLAYRNNAGKRLSYEPGKIEEIHIKMWPIAWQISKGSKIRLDISSSDFPQYSIHSNMPGVWSHQKKSKKALQTIYMGEKYPSRISIPVKTEE